MRAFVTGGTGFIGSHIVDELLKRGYEVVVAKRKTSNLAYLQLDKVSLCEIDFSDTKTLEGKLRDINYIFHIAGAIKAKSKGEFFRHNRDITVNLVNVARSEASGLKRFVFVGSLASFGPSSNGYKKESDPCCPITVYGISKLEGAKAVKDSGLPYTLFFPPAVYGPRDRSFLGYFRVMKMGIAPVVGSAKRRVSVVYVGNLAKAVVDAAEKSEAENEDFFVADEGVQSWESFIKMASSIMGRKVKLIEVPLPVAVFIGASISFFARLFGSPSLIDKEKVKEFACEWICSTEKIRELVGFTPIYTTEEGLRITINWYKTNGYL